MPAFIKRVDRPLRKNSSKHRGENDRGYGGGAIDYGSGGANLSHWEHQHFLPSGFGARQPQSIVYVGLS